MVKHNITSPKNVKDCKSGYLWSYKFIWNQNYFWKTPKELFSTKVVECKLLKEWFVRFCAKTCHWRCINKTWANSYSHETQHALNLGWGTNNLLNNILSESKDVLISFQPISLIFLPKPLSQTQSYVHNIDFFTKFFQHLLIIL
jgi:hypothetical protein